MIELKSAVPPAIHKEWDETVTWLSNHCTLIVPKGSYEAYRNASEWGEFVNIVEK